MTPDSHTDVIDPAAAHDEHALAHPVSVRILISTFLALVALTGVTVGAAYIPLGDANVWVALFIAAFKASLVVLYFMHLRWEKNHFNGIAIITAIFFVSLFLGITILDTNAYAPNYTPPSSVTAQP